MDDAVRDILDALRAGELDPADPAQLDRIIRKHSARARDGRRVFAKKRILPYYLEARSEGGGPWASWDVDDDLHALFVRAMQMKPRRTASGVATITVITKPWPCANDCLYCPNDERMPKSYLRDEPACQRAERNGFHPYLQTASRLCTLQKMGHATDKVELIVLGGTWMDYPRDYRMWFVAELFRALNAASEERNRESERIRQDDEYRVQATSWDDISSLQIRNESAGHRVVGLVVETRPNTVTCDSLREMRRLGCTKVQMGVQSIDADILRANGRDETPEDVSRSLDLARLFGFKTHTHFMLNLYGATPESDAADYRAFANDSAFSPDEVKLYPCALVAGTRLVEEYEKGTWRPYDEDELVSTLCACMEATPRHMRVSRMIRDISAKDILVGNKKTNLRQIVDGRLRDRGANVDEIRFREIATGEVDLDALQLSESGYETRATREVFLEWTTPEGLIAGFLRLSLPKPEALERFEGLPVGGGEAMIREVHVYGFATRVGSEGDSAQHHGLGRRLVGRACEIARAEGYAKLNVISAVGTRGYYRSLGFEDGDLYQSIDLSESFPCPPTYS